MLKWLGLGLLLGTGFGIAWAQSPTKFDGQYRGELTLTKVIKAVPSLRWGRFIL